MYTDIYFLIYTYMYAYIHTYIQGVRDYPDGRISPSACICRWVDRSCLFSTIFKN